GANYGLERTAPGHRRQQPDLHDLWATLSGPNVRPPGTRMQRTVEQRHTTKRRTSTRRHPKAFGFTARQQPFIMVLVANWIFSLSFFLGMKLIWHWQPDAWGIADRLALVIKGAVFALLPGIVGICIVAAQRLDPSMWVGRTPKPNSSLDINTRFILNTFEQF